MGVHFSQESCPILSISEEKKKDVLNFDLTLNGISKKIISEKIKNIIVMSGAGISVSAGLPDFRSPDTGLYDTLATLSIPYPEAVFSIEFFKKYPEPFYKVLSRFLYSEYHPTLAHFFIRLLHEKQLLLRHYTQNVDGLEFLTEIPEDLVVQAHGTLFEIHCIECGRRFPFSVFRKVLKENFQWLRCSTLNQFVPDGFKSNAEFIPGQVQQNGTTLAHRDRCMGYVKPNIVFFGEQLPPRFFEMVPQDFVKADLLLILGTSATVQPFAQLIDMVPNHCPRLLINKEVVGVSPNDNSLFQFHNANNYRDVFFQGDCDDGVQRLCSLCGWENDLKRLQSSYVKLRGELYWKKLEALKS